MLTYKIEENKDGSWGDVRTDAALTIYDAEQYEDIMRAFAEIFGKFGIIISDIYHDEEDAIEVVDIWFPTGIVFYAIATANIKPL